MSNAIEQKEELGPQFFQQCVSYLAETGEEIECSDGKGKKWKENSWAHISRHQQSGSTTWHYDLKNGVPVYDDSNWAWRFAQYDNGFGLLVDIGEDRRVSFTDGEACGGAFWLRVKLWHSFEMGELLELIRELTPANCNGATLQEMPWSGIIQDIFMLIPNDKEQRLVKFSWAQWEKNAPQLLKWVKLHYSGLDYVAIYAEEEELDCWSWGDWVGKHPDELKALTSAGELEDADLLFGQDNPEDPNSGFRGAREYLSLCKKHQSFDDEPKLVIRLKPQYSRMYFVDFVERTEEGESLFNALKCNLENLPQLLNQRVKYATTRIAQIRLGVELRVAIRAYEDKVGSLVRQREPSSQIQERYRQRAKHVNVLHTEFLSEIEVQQSPLPFMVEWLLRRYQRADDALDKIKFGSQLFTLLCKLPTLLALEELNAVPEHQPLCGLIVEEHFSKPATDGDLIKCMRAVLNQVAKAQISLSWFGELLESFRNEGCRRLDKIVPARNNFHHNQHDAKEMLAALENEIPPLIALLRKSMKGLVFITPSHMVVKEDKCIVVARRLMGFESDFPKVEFETTASHKAFQSGKIVVVNDDHTKELPLIRFFKSEDIQTVSLDFAIFNYMKNGHPQFVYLRRFGKDLP
jgi:hypothetical protein